MDDGVEAGEILRRHVTHILGDDVDGIDRLEPLGVAGDEIAGLEAGDLVPRLGQNAVATVPT